MGKSWIGALFCALALTGAQAGELEDILAKHYQALGGLEALAAVKSLEIEGTMTRNFRGGAMETPMKLRLKDRTKLRVDMVVRGATMTRVFDGEKGWWTNPRNGGALEAVGSDQLEALKAQADFLGELHQWREKGYALELLGKADVEGTETYAVKVSKPDGKTKTFYLDSEYYVVVKTSGVGGFRGRTAARDVYFSDYKRVGGVLMAHSMVVKAPEGGRGGGMEQRFEKITVNPEIADTAFAMPKKQ